MAGYLFTLDSEAALFSSIQSGQYATKLNPPYWGPHHEGTIADYATMEAGDNVYFFVDRKIYGIGELVNIGGHCKYQLFPDAGRDNIPGQHEIRERLLHNYGETSHMHRVICFFEPSPHFLSVGVDMDDVLASNPADFRILRAMWKRSFIKFDDTENQAFKDIILKRNVDALSNPLPGENVIPCKLEKAALVKKLGEADYLLGSLIMEILEFASDGNALRHEMALEMGLLHQLAEKEESAISTFGEWEYLSHQVVASPFKPIDYMDRMDVFGYSFIPDHKPTVNRYLIAELKKGKAQEIDADQLLRYVDWIRDEYSHGDYSLVHAYIVAREIPLTVINRLKEIGLRRYTIGVRPTQSLAWFNIKTVSYLFNPKTNRLEFTLEWDSMSEADGDQI